MTMLLVFDAERENNINSIKNNLFVYKIIFESSQKNFTHLRQEQNHVFL